MMEGKKQDVLMLSPSLNQPKSHTVGAEVTCQRPDLSPTDVFKRRRAGVAHCHAITGARPYYSPEYSPDFYKSSRVSQHETWITSCIKAESFPLQHSTQTRVPYLEKKRLLDKQEEIREVKQLDEWRPPVGILTEVLQGLDNRGN